MCGGGSSGSSSTQAFTPPSWTTGYGTQGQGPWQDYLTRAINQSNMPYQGYQGQTVADINPEQNAGLNMTAQTAMQSSPDVLAGRGQITDTASGNYLNSNPWLGSQYTDAVINQNANNMAQAYRLGTGAQTDAAFARGGAYGGSAYNQMQAANAAGLANSIGQMANNYQLQRTGMGSQDYQSERANQMQASGMAPGLQNMDLQAGAALTGVGDAYRGYTQDLLNAGQNQYNASQLYPWQSLDNLGSALARASGNAAGGSTTTAQQNYQASPFANMLGLGALAYGGYRTLGQAT